MKARLLSEPGPMLEQPYADAYASGYLAGLNLDDPDAHPWALVDRVARRFQSKRIAAWRRGYDAGNAERIRSTEDTP